MRKERSGGWGGCLEGGITTRESKKDSHGGQMRTAQNSPW